MEDRLKRLIATAEPQNRYRAARAWQGEGKKVVGIFGSYVPEEVVHAAGMLPVRVIGTWDTGVELARVHRPVVTCQYGTHVLESVLRGEFDFLNGVIASNRDQDLVRTWDVWHSLGKPAFSCCLHVPKKDSDLSCRVFATEMRKLLGALQAFSGQSDDGALERSSAVYDETARLLQTVYNWRRRPVSPLTGAECLGLVLAAGLMPREQFNAELTALLPYIERRQIAAAADRPRVLLTAEFLDNPAYVALVEDAGCTVVMDDADTGSRYFWPAANAGAPNSDPALALAAKYLRRPAGPHLGTWATQVQHIAAWAGEFRAAGVLEFLLENDKAAEMRSPTLRSRLNAVGVANASFGRDYAPQNLGALRTRVEAFVEMLGA